MLRPLQLQSKVFRWKRQCRFHGSRAVDEEGCAGQRSLILPAHPFTFAGYNSACDLLPWSGMHQ